jgi:ADP-heptose:LPS heptosyltransferase
MLVIHQGALGDFILALPPLEILRKTFPRARSVFMGYPRILELVENRFYAEEMLSIDQKGMASFFVREGALDLNLSQIFKTFDLIVVFGRDPDGSLIGNLNRVCQGQILPIHSFPCWDERIHLTDHLLRELSHYGLSTSESIPRIYLNEADHRWGEQYWNVNGVTPQERAGVVILHPGSGSKKKVWAVDRFLDLMKHLRDTFIPECLLSWTRGRG